jgi:SAM-dependent methyltransferase
LHSPPFECIYARNYTIRRIAKEKTDFMPAPESAIFDRDLQLAFRRRAFRRAEPGADFLLRRVAEDLADRLDAVERRFPVAIDLAGHNGLAAEAIAFSGKADTVLRVERDADFLKGPFPAVVGDEELLPIKPGSADLIVSLMALHATNDTPGAMVQIARALKPDGLFLAALSGSGTLGELRESLLQAEIELTGGASPRVFPFADVRDVGGLLQRAGFALPVTDVENVTVRYDSLFNLMADLRAMGMQNIVRDRSRRPVSKRLFLRAAEIYAERFSDPDGRIRATFSIIWLSGWAPHESQQKPLKPGSAKASLADALKKAEEE